MKLQSANLEGLEATLIRNLTDHHGNNLLHAVCSHGHVNLLPWVTRRFAGELNGALSDENRRGFTPIVYAIKVRVLATINICGIRINNNASSKLATRIKCIISNHSFTLLSPRAHMLTGAIVDVKA